jgi:hypothetical protein
MPSSFDAVRQKRARRGFLRLDVNDRLLGRWRQPLGDGVEPVENAGFVIDVLDLDTASVSLDTAAAPRPAERSARTDLDGCLAIMHQSV